jgi:hypothetical protein
MPVEDRAKSRPARRDTSTEFGHVRPQVSKAGVTIKVRTAWSTAAAPAAGAPSRAEDTSRGEDGAALLDDSSQRHLLRRAATVGLLMRHSVNAGVAVVALAAPHSGMTPAGRWLLAGLICWSLYRLATRSQRWAATSVDFGFTVAVCLAIPLLTTDPAFYLSNSAPQAIAGTSVISFAVSLPALVSLPVTVVIAGAYAVGVAAVLGWGRVDSVLAEYYFGLQWVTSSLIRIMLLRVAAAVDRTREAREAAAMTRRVDEAVRVFEREQLALLHDTAASTLLMVGQGAELPPRRVAAQARRDLDLLHDGPWRPTPARMELVAALRDAVIHARTPARFEGVDALWLDGEVAGAVVAATREAMNNVDRHAGARSMTITVGDDSVAVADDGAGFDGGRAVRGHGIDNSMAARMDRVGGSATVSSTPGAGTRVRLRWPAGHPAPESTAPTDPDRLIERIRFIYAAALGAYAIANLITTVPYAVAHAGRPAAQIALAVVAGLCPILALPALRGRTWVPVQLGMAAVFVVAVAGPLLLSPDKVGSQADWVQAGIGWCALPLVLTRRTPRAAGVLVGLWMVGAVVEVARHPVAESLVNVGFGTGSILGVQLFALAFDGLMRDAAADAHADVEAYQRLVVRDRVARAVAEDYRRRYAKLVDQVVPLLQRLSAGDPVTQDLQREARAESRRLRALFDQTRIFEHVLMQRLRRAVDVAEARGVDVVVDVSGELPDLEEGDVEGLVAPLRRVLSADMSSAHVVVSAGPESLSLSVVCRGAADPLAVAAELRADGANEIVTTDDTVWVIVEHPANPTEGD